MFSLQYKHVLHFSNNQIAWKHNKSGRNQRPPSNFENGGGGGAPLVTQYWGGGSKHFFLLILYNFKNIGGGGAHAPPVPLLSGPWEFGSFEKPSLGQPAF